MEKDNNRASWLQLVIASAVAVLCYWYAFSAPFVTPAMMKRNGLTDEQYKALWAIGRNPRIDIGTARDWMFRANRYQNVTNWLDICGKDDDFAALSYDLQDKNFKLDDTNKVLKAENRVLVSSNEVLVVENEYLVATNAVLEVDAKKAQKVAKNAEKARKKDQKNFEKWVSDTKKAKSKSSEDMAEFYDSVLELAGEK